MKSRGRSLLHLVSPRLLLPGVAVTAAFLLALGFYDFRTTGNVLLMPYQVNEAAYDPVPIFLWQSPRATPPEYRNAAIRAYWTSAPLGTGWEAAQYYGWRFQPILKVFSICYAGWRYFFRTSAVALIPILACFWMARLPWVRYGALIVLISLLGQIPVRGSTEAHYLAPVTGLFFLFSAGGIRFFSILTYRSQKRARAVPALILIAWLLSFVAEAATAMNEPEKARAGEYQVAGSEVFRRNRRAILAQLNRDPARHLVIVRYTPDHNVYLEWVYNRASIDESVVVWARDRGPQENIVLIRYFRERKVWLLNADAERPSLIPYTLEPSQK
jgi:hypothetical protein